MERENGFGVLSSLLTTKLCQPQPDLAAGTESPGDPSKIQQSVPDLSLTILIETLKFVGYRMDKPEDSVINNPLAYRILLVDMDFWRSAEPKVQKVYYEQFMMFGLHSKFHQFNTKRLLRMRRIHLSYCYNYELLAYLSRHHEEVARRTQRRDVHYRDVRILP